MSSMNHTITAGLILVLSIVMAFVIQTVANIFPEDALVAEEDAETGEVLEYTQLGSLVNTLPILLVIIGLIGAFVILARTAREAGNGGRGGLF